MFHLTIFAGTEVDMTPREFTSVTLFGGAELRLPTLASQVLHLRNPPEKSTKAWERWLQTDENLVVTIMAGSEIGMQRIADEYLALAGLLASSQMTADELANSLDQLLANPDLRAPYKTLTLFGGCARKEPDESQERDALRRARNSGAIDERTYDALAPLIVATPEGRIQGLRQLLSPVAEPVGATW